MRHVDTCGKHPWVLFFFLSLNALIVFLLHYSIFFYTTEKQKGMPRLKEKLDHMRQICGTCNQTSLHGRVFCDICEKWYHASCEQMTTKDLKDFSELPLDFPYICIGCRTTRNGFFDFQSALKRLHKVIYNIGDLGWIAIRYVSLIISSIIILIICVLFLYW